MRCGCCVSGKMTMTSTLAPSGSSGALISMRSADQDTLPLQQSAFGQLRGADFDAMARQDRGFHSQS
jgi:aminoglycoside phosphotransferase family enzyme